MKLVVLDGYAMNPGDLSWDDLGSLGELAVYDRTQPELTIERAKDAEAVFTNKVILGAEQIRQLPKLRYIGVLATGTNVVDLPAATARRIVVTNVPACRLAIPATRKASVTAAGSNRRISATGISR